MIIKGKNLLKKEKETFVSEPLETSLKLSTEKKDYSLKKFRIRHDERMYFMENLSLLLGSGMDILLALKAIQQGEKSEKLAGLITHLIENIEEGSPLWKALLLTNLLSANLVYLVRLGEETGQLPENLKVIVKQLNKEKEFRSKLRSALLYPIIVLSLTVVVGISIAWFILPRLSRVFTELQLELPLITRVLIGIGNFLHNFGFIAIPTFFMVCVILGYVLFVYHKTKHLGQRILISLPGVRVLIQELEIARFGFILGTLLKAGVEITNALKSLCEGTRFLVYQKFYLYLRDSVEVGNSFQKSFSSYEKINTLVPVPIQQMIMAAEQSGHLAGTLLRIGKIFERKTDVTTRNLSILLEPILLFVIWIVVVMVALAVILPIYSLIGGINK